MSLFIPPWLSAFGQNVRPSDGAKLYFYEAGTSTPKTVYSDINETVALSNPVIAAANGRFPAIFLGGTFKVIMTDKNDVVQDTEDNLAASTTGFNWAGDFDSSTNAGDYPASGQLGDVYRVTEKFVLNAASGSYQLYLYDFIVANKNGSTGIEADWNIIKGKDWLIDEDDFASDDDTLAPSQQSVKTYLASQILDEDDFASDSATKAPSQQSAGFYIREGTYEFQNKTIDSSKNTVELKSSSTNVVIDIDSSDGSVTLDIDTAQAGTTINDASTTVKGVVEKSTSAENLAGSSDIVYPTPKGVKEEMFSATGLAPVFACRAWANWDMDAAGSPVINAGGNFDPFTDNGQGDQTANFTVNMPDTDYAPFFSGQGNTAVVVGGLSGLAGGAPDLKSTSQFRFRFRDTATNVLIDTINAAVMVMR